MPPPGEWVPPLLMALVFLPFGALKLYGFLRGYEGGPGLPIWQRLRAGACAEEHCKLPPRVRRPLFLTLWLCFLAIGIAGLVQSLRVVR